MKVSWDDYSKYMGKMFPTTNQFTIKSGLNMIEMKVNDTETVRKLHPVTVGHLPKMGITGLAKNGWFPTKHHPAISTQRN
jgi:hypothetical protein